MIGRSVISLVILCSLLALQLPVAGQNRRGTQPVRPETDVQTAGQSAVLKSKKNEKLAAAFQSGHLPEPLRRPQGTPDEVAVDLAKRIAAGDDQSLPALLTAIMTAGFGIRDTDGGLTQTVEPGQGLIFEAWEVAAMAKMYGERRTVELSYFTDALKLIPELKQAPLEKVLVEGIRKQASSQQPELRFWARFIVELGKRSAWPYDMLNLALDKIVRIDAIQNALILRRLQGDIYAMSKPPAQGLRRFDRSTTVATARQSKPLYSHASQTQPCTLSAMEATVADIQALGATTAFGELMSFVKGKIGGGAGNLFGYYGKFANIANILLAYTKFILTYASLETEITVDNPPLVRNTSTAPGQIRQLTARVTMNIGKMQQVNCFRWLLNYGTGLDFSLMNDGPIEGVMVNWHITQGGGADFYDTLDRDRQIVRFAGTGPRIQDAGTYAGIPGKGGTPVSNLTSTRTDAKGKARILLEGASRKNQVQPPHTAVMKKALVVTTVKLKGGDLKSDAVDVVGHVSGGMISLGKGKGLGDSAAGMFTLPLELLYRTDWASTAMIEVSVKDWETCESDDWQGTISYVKEFNHSWTHKGDKGQSTTIQKETYVSTITFKGQRISAYGAPVAGSPNLTNVLNANVITTATYDEKYNSTGNRECNRSLERIIALSSDSQSTGSVSVRITPDQRYTVHYQVPNVSAEGYVTTSWRLEGDCRNPFMDKSGGRKTLMSRGIGIHPVEIEGAIDPNNPRVLTGSKTETVERNGGTMTLTVRWHITHCDTP